MDERVSFEVYRIETDDFSGRLGVKLSFRPHTAEITRSRDSLTGLIVADVMDGGLVGALTAPAGAKLVELGDGTRAIRIAEGTVLGAGEAVRAAKASGRHQSFGLGWSPARTD
jgi:hypothetical protein